MCGAGNTVIGRCSGPLALEGEEPGGPAGNNFRGVWREKPYRRMDRGGGVSVNEEDDIKLASGSGTGYQETLPLVRGAGRLHQETLGRTGVKK